MREVILFLLGVMVVVLGISIAAHGGPSMVHCRTSATGIGDYCQEQPGGAGPADKRPEMARPPVR